jgi:hypothetical protein
MPPPPPPPPPLAPPSPLAPRSPLGGDGHFHSPHTDRRHSATSSRHTDLSVTDLSKLRRLGSVTTKLQYTKPRRRLRQPVLDAFNWWARWSVPGLGMFSEAWVIFSIGLIGPFQVGCF